MASKVSLLGQRLRGAQFEVSDLRGNIDHLLQDLEDAVFIFNRELPPGLRVRFGGEISGAGPLRTSRPDRSPTCFRRPPCWAC